MTTTLRQLAALLLSTAILFTGNGLINTLLPVRAEIEAFSTLEIGLLGTVYFAGFILGCLNVPLLVRRVGHIRTFATLSSVVAATALAHVFLIDPIAWGRAALLHGLRVRRPLRRDRELAERPRRHRQPRRHHVGLHVHLPLRADGRAVPADGLRPGRVLSCSRWSPFSSRSRWFPVSLTKAPEPPRPATIGLDIAGLWRLSPVGFVGCLSVGLVNGSFWTLGPIFASRSGLDIDNLVYFIAGATLAGAVAQWPLGLISDRIDRRFVIIGATLCAAVSGVLLSTWAEPSTTLLIGLSAAFGGFAMPLYAVSVAHANDMAEDTRFVTTAGGLLLVYGLGASLGPLIASALMGYYGNGGLFMFTTSVHAALALFTIVRIALRRRPTQEDRSDFVAVAAHLAHPLRAGPALRAGIGRRQAALMRSCLRDSGGRLAASRPLSQTVRRPLDHHSGFPSPIAAASRARLWVLSAGLCMSLGGPIIRLADDSTPWQFLFYRSIGAAAIILVYFLVTRRPVLELVRSAGVNGLVGGLGARGRVHRLCVGCDALHGGERALSDQRIAPGCGVPWLDGVARAGGPFDVVRHVRRDRRCHDHDRGGSGRGRSARRSGGARLGGWGLPASRSPIRRGRDTDMSPTILIGAAITTAFSAVMAAASGTGLAAPMMDVGLAAAYGVLVIGAGIFMLTIGARNVPAAELLVLSLTEVVFASIWVWLAFGEVPSVLTLVGGLIILGSIGGPGRRRHATVGGPAHSLHLGGALPHELRAEAAPPDDGVLAELFAHRVQRLIDFVLGRRGAAEEVALDAPTGLDRPRPPE